MSMTSNGSHECDKCGSDVDNGSVTSAVVVSDLDPDNPGMVRNLHFCRDKYDEDGKKIHDGCAQKVLNATHLKHYKEKRNG